MQPICRLYWGIVGANPSLTEAAHMTRDAGDKGWRHRWSHRAWTLVYARNTAIRCRIGSVASPWRVRLANTLLLIPPGTPYWEDAPQIDFDYHLPQELRRPVHRLLAFTNAHNRCIVRFNGPIPTQSFQKFKHHSCSLCSGSNTRQV
jgi:hypothetical protein